MCCPKKLAQTDMTTCRALSSSGPGFVKVNGYSGESCGVKDSVEISHINSHNSHISIPSACCSANRELKDLFWQQTFILRHSRTGEILTMVVKYLFVKIVSCRHFIREVQAGILLLEPSHFSQYWKRSSS